MKKVAIIVLLFVSAVTLSAQKLPADLDAAVKIPESGFNQELLDTMLNYKVMQQVQLGMDYDHRDDIIKTIEQKKRVIKNRKATGWTSFLTSVLAGGAYAFLAVSGNEAYDNYLNASVTDEAVDYREQFELYDLLGYVSLGVVGVGAGVSAISFSNTPSLDNLNSKLIAVDKKIEFLEGVLQ